MTSQSPLARFSDRAKDYAKYRPTYPEAAILKVLAPTASIGLQIPRVADVGAGTGISARLMADRGAQVIAIEPNLTMTQAATHHPGVVWQAGQAEATELPPQSVNLVTCFQSFHWFEPDQALPEFHRILSPQGTLALVWNDRDPSEGFTQALEHLIQGITRGNYLNSENRRSITAIEASPLFGPLQHSTFPHRQVLDYEGLLGRCRSSSYIPKTGESYGALVAGLEQLFHQWRSDQDTVEILYQTHVYLTQKQEKG
jgi:SAM-dependent methyltransferase